ncbi:unnamed protein product [Pedinophyceae sp. YPF-701]|nr:unnamed protein product [Pedinophyceae sp. YPF-701]
MPGDFSIGAAPMLVPPGPWEVIEGNCVTAKGFKAQGMHAGMRAKGTKADLALVVADEAAVAGGVFTQNVMCAAPVTLSKDNLAKSDRIKAVIINAGQANAATGRLGMEDAVKSAQAVAQQLGCKPEEVLVQSTGVIGQRIKFEKLIEGLPTLAAGLGSEYEDGHRAAVAITTTDLVSKSCALKMKLSDGTEVTLGGMCKGSGMIHPNMATMLGTLTCDAAVDAQVWRGMLSRCIRDTFNQISVDGDTSTNDCVFALASGAAGNAPITDAESEDGKLLESALKATLAGMCKAIAWDGEGATALVECKCTGAATDDDARTVSRSVVCSSLAKAAIYGHDPNWGRIACAAGYSGVQFDQEKLAVTLGGIKLMENGQPLAFDKKEASNYLKSQCDVHGVVNIDVSIGDGPGEGVAWGCDLSYDYVKINAEYTT